MYVCMCCWAASHCSPLQSFLNVKMNNGFSSLLLAIAIVWWSMIKVL